MFSVSWLRSLAKLTPRSSRCTRRSATNRTFRPGLESLEERTLLSVNFVAPNFYSVPVNNTDIPVPAGSLANFSPIEPQVTVNPNNPAQIAYSDQSLAVVSTNAGGSFTTVGAGSPFVAGFPLANSGGDTSTAYDAQGKLHWVNLDGNNNFVPTIAEVNPVTGIVGTPGPIDTPPVVNGNQTSEDKGFLATDGVNLFEAFERYPLPGQAGTPTIMLSRSSNGGGFWSAPVTVSGANEGFVWPSSVSVGSGGDVYVAYHAEPNGKTTGEVRVARYSNDLSQQISNTIAFVQGSAVRRTSYPGEAFPVVGGSGGSLGVAGPTVLADPAHPGSVYLFSINDPSGSGSK